MATTTDTTDLTALTERYFEAWEARDADAIAAYHSPDGVFHLHAGSEAVEGRDAIRETFAGLFAQWPDFEAEIKRVLFHDRGWALDWTMRGTLAEPLELEGATVGRPGARMEVDAVDIVDVEDGLLKAKHTFVDSVTLLRQVAATQ
jgi:steroid delta-isomerase-like uncharacterized protein